MSAGNSTTTSMQVSLSKVGLGYGIAIAVGILVLVSTIMLASYVCMRLHQAVDGRQNENNAAVVPHHHNHHQAAAADGNGNGSGGGGLADWVVAGLDQATLESYPKLAFSSAQPLPHLQEDDTSCSICLADYKEGDILRMLPDCHHLFHVSCIDAWLPLHASCPMCRTSPLPTPQSTPVSTPLSELIPLARHHLQLRSHV